MLGLMVYDSPIGRLSCIFDGGILIKITINDQYTYTYDYKIIDSHPFRWELDDYFRGVLRVFSQRIGFIGGTGFQKNVWARIMDVPFGHTITYKEIALSLKIKKGFQAVGVALGKNPIPIVVPCQRVVGSDGSLRGFSYGVAIKEWLIRHEQNCLKLTTNV
ncbi:MAG: methylated-DNA--[protein]-cysteine S-methyltransferase [Thermodesulfovibrionales bacterium]